MNDIQAYVLFVWMCFGVNVCEVGLSTRLGWMDGG